MKLKTVEEVDVGELTVMLPCLECGEEMWCIVSDSDEMICGECHTKHFVTYTIKYKILEDE